MTAPDRETLAAALRASLIPHVVSAEARAHIAYRLAEALPAGPLAAPPGDGGSELPDEVRKRARDRVRAWFPSEGAFAREAADAAVEVAYSAGRAAGRADERAAVASGPVRAGSASYAVGRADERAAISRFINEQIANYPRDVFPDDSTTLDGVAARALRVMLPILASRIERGEHLDD